MPDASARVTASMYRRFFAALLDPAITAVVVRDGRGEVVDWILTDINEAGVAKLGSIGWVRGRAASEAGDLSLTPFPIALVRQALRDQRPVRVEADVGGTACVSSIYPLDGDAWAGTCSDNAGRKRVEEALRESEERLQEALRASRSFAFEWQPASDRVTRSLSCAGLLGLDGDEAIHDTSEGFFRRIHPEDQQPFTALVRSLRPGADHYEAKYRILRPDGRVIVVEETARAYFDASGTFLRMIGITTDVTAREEAEDRRRKVEERLSVAKEAASLGIHDYDVTTGSVQWDSRVRALFGVDEGEPITYEVFLSGVHPDDREAVQAEMAKALDPSGDGRYYREYRAVNRRDGSERWLAATGQVFFEGGIAVRLIGTVQDVTERKRTEEALREADRRKNEFIAVLSHELRNPLAPIRFAIPVLQSQPLDAEGSRAVNVIARQTDHLAGLVEDLLDLSRITTGKIMLRPEVVALAPVLTAAVEAASPALAARRHSLRMTVADEPMWLNADPVRIAQVVTNLLDNSAKYTPPGGEIELQARPDDGGLRIAVRDSGAGIPANQLAAVFEMFHRLDRPEESQGGLGIGLAIAKRLIEMHGGTIEARSAGPGKGSEFVVRLPAAEPMLAPLRSDALGKSRPRRSLKVLVVDDNADMVEMLALVVERLGHEVRKTMDGQSALAAALAFHPDVVLLDLGMPVMNGYELAAEMRRRPELAGARLVALTGWGQQEDRQRTRDAGFDGHLIKPADVETLEKLLSAYQVESEPSVPPGERR